MTWLRPIPLPSTTHGPLHVAESAAAAKTADALKADVTAAQGLASRASASKATAQAAFAERQASLAARDAEVVTLFQQLRLESDATASMQLQVEQERQRIADLTAKLAAADEAYDEAVGRACAPAALRLQQAKDAVAAFQQRISVRVEEWESTRASGQLRLDDTRGRVATLAALHEQVATTTQQRTHNARVRAALRASTTARTDAHRNIADAALAAEKATALPAAITSIAAEADSAHQQALSLRSQQRLATALAHTQHQSDAAVIAQLLQLQQQAAGAMVETAAYDNKCTAILQAVADNVAAACLQRLEELDSVAASAGGQAAVSAAGMAVVDGTAASGQALATAMQVLHGQLTVLVEAVGAARAVAAEAQTLFDAAGAGLSPVEDGELPAAALGAAHVQRIRAAIAATAGLQARLRTASTAVIEAATALTPSAAGIRDVIAALNCRSSTMRAAVEALQAEASTCTIAALGRHRARACSSFVCSWPIGLQVSAKHQERDTLLARLKEVQAACAAAGNVDQKMAELTLAHEEDKMEVHWQAGCRCCWGTPSSSLPIELAASLTSIGAWYLQASATWAAKRQEAQAAHAARLSELQAATAAAKAQADSAYLTAL